MDQPGYNPINTPRLVIAAPASGSGKTTLTLGIMAALKKRGVIVQGFKCGPDYIDPGYHTAVTGRISRNLDSWFAGPQGVRQGFERGVQKGGAADLAIIEGVMGLFDGRDPLSDEGSTADIAAILQAPVILVVDARSQARSAAALVKGFQVFSEKIKITGVIINRSGSKNHTSILKEAIEKECGIPVLGALERSQTSDIAIPERHLGLLPAIERGELDPLFARLGEIAESSLDLDALVSLAKSAPPLEIEPEKTLEPEASKDPNAESDEPSNRATENTALRPEDQSIQNLDAASQSAAHSSESNPEDTAQAPEAPSIQNPDAAFESAAQSPVGKSNKSTNQNPEHTAQTPKNHPIQNPDAPSPHRQSTASAPLIAVAKDSAFHFYYPENIELLEELGAKIEYFSPLQNDPLPPGTNGLYIGGGFPEEFAATLARNALSKESIAGAITAGMPAIAECGGFMYLTDAIICREQKNSENKEYSENGKAGQSKKKDQAETWSAREEVEQYKKRDAVQDSHQEARLKNRLHREETSPGPGAPEKTIRYEMCALIPGEVIMQAKLAALGYREAQGLDENRFLHKDEIIKGHEFHYSRFEPGDGALPAAFLSTGRTGTKQAGALYQNLAASYLHLYFPSQVNFARRFVEACRNFSVLP